MNSDTQRLDWLQQHAREVWKDGRVFVVLPDGNPLKCSSGSGRSLREAIDDAMAKNADHGMRSSETRHLSPALSPVETERERAEGTLL